MKHEFRVVYTPIEDGWIMAQAPELPGAVTQGETIEEARAMLRECIELLLESYRANAERDAPGNAVWETIAIDLPGHSQTLTGVQQSTSLRRPLASVPSRRSLRG